MSNERKAGADMTAQTVVRRRADAGHPRATERDAELMAWVVEMGGVPFDLLRQIAAPYTTDGKPMTDGSTRNMIRRWRIAGWAAGAQVGAGPMWIWATDSGCRLFGRHPYAGGQPSAARLAHTRAVIVARLQLTGSVSVSGRHPTWRSERELRFELGQVRGSAAARQHLVDGVLEVDDDKGMRAETGVEVELSPKPSDRLKANMLAGADTAHGGYSRVIWFVNGRTRVLVERVWGELTANVRNRLQIRDLGGV